MISPVMPTYGRDESTIAFERGEGVYLYTPAGERYLDFAAGIAVNALGHCHPHLVKTLQEQAARLWHTSNLYRIPAGETLAKRLIDNSFADTVFFCNSGTEAIEGAIKVARRYHHVSGSPERKRIIACDSSFHGRTLAALAAAGNKKYLEGYEPAAGGFDHVAFGNLNEMRAAVGPETAAILVEPVQGEGGIRPAQLDYLRALRQIADEFGILLVFDEVQCGMGRTGKLFAYEWAGAAPDVMALAKGLGSGFPMGAVLASEKAAAGMTTGSHGSTFGGNPLAMAVGNAVMDVMLADGFLPRVEKMGKYLRGKVEALAKRFPKVYREVRGSGLMLGIVCVPTNTEVAAKLRAEKLLTATAGENVVRLLPPLIIEESHADEAVSALERVAASWPA